VFADSPTNTLAGGAAGSVCASPCLAATLLGHWLGRRLLPVNQAEMLARRQWHQVLAPVLISARERRAGPGRIEAAIVPGNNAAVNLVKPNWRDDG
jgi:hypothetical protein